MLLTFIDLSNGLTFNGDKPYVFWFSEGQSANQIYVNRIAFLSDSEYELVETEQDTPFFLIDQNSFQSSQQTIINTDAYFDLNDIKTISVLSRGIQYSPTSYVHLAWMCASSDAEGQFKASFSVGNKSYTVGADFYNYNEILTSNLENLGIEISQTVQRAIYESNVHEDATDNILMNRKWKELLLEYWRISACKGSYDSLVSSLKWFEYNDLIKILEYWRRTDVGRQILVSNDIERIMNDLFREQLSVLSKTTYIGLYLALERPSNTRRTDDFYPFFNSEEVWASPTPAENPDNLPWSQYSGRLMVLNENNPVLERISAIWGTQDLMLKMTLVGNFFASHFMPIHLDLVHSTVENITFTNSIKVMSGGMQSREDWFNCGSTFRCDSVRDNSNWYIQPVDCEVGPRTILGIKDASFSDLSTDNPAIVNEQDTLGSPPECPTVLGYNLFRGDTLGNNSTDTDDLAQEIDIRDILFNATNRYRAYGAPVRFDVSITENVCPDDFIKAAQIHWVRNETERFDYRDSGIYIEPDENSDSVPSYEFSFNLLFEKAGKYDISIIFESSRGIWYSRKFTINAIDNADNQICIYKITRGDINSWKDTELLSVLERLFIRGPEDGEILSDINEFQFSATDAYPELKYSQFIHADSTDFSKSVGLNHVIMVPDTSGTVPATQPVTLSYADGSSSLSVANATEDSLKAAFPNYWWIVKKTEIWMENENRTEPFDSSFKGTLLNDKRKVIIGLRKYFSTDSSSRNLFDKTYKFNGMNYRVVITQVGTLAMTIHVKCTNGPGESIKTVPLSSRAEVDILGIHKMTVNVVPDTSGSSNSSSEWAKPEKRILVSGYNPRIVDEDRFVPLFHRLVLVTDSNYELAAGETCIAVPFFSRTLQDNIDELTISFVHCGTASVTSQKTGVTSEDDENGIPTKVGLLAVSQNSVGQSIIAEYQRKPLARGFYDVEVRYKYDGLWHTEKKEGAFNIKTSSPTAIRKYKTYE